MEEVLFRKIWKDGLFIFDNQLCNYLQMFAKRELKQVEVINFDRFKLAKFLSKTRFCLNIASLKAQVQNGVFKIHIYIFHSQSL